MIEFLAICYGPHDPPHKGEFYWWPTKVSANINQLTNDMKELVIRRSISNCPECGKKPDIVQRQFRLPDVER